MNILQTLTLRQIKGDPSRFRVTVLGVALATAMVTAVLLGADSALAALYGAAALANGSWHWTASGPESAVQPLLEEEIFTDAALAVCLAQNSAPGAPIPVQCTGLYTRGEQAWGMLALELADGAVPAAEHDLLIDENLAAAGPYAVGDSLILTDAGTGTGTDWTVCGIFHRFAPVPAGDEVYNTVCALDESALPALPEQGRADLYAHLRDFGPAAQERVGQLKRQMMDAGGGGRYNAALTFADVPIQNNGGDNLRLLVDLLRGFLLTLTAGAAVLLIVNAFSISVAERRRSLGMLASAGATRAQKMACIGYEALFVGLLGIPAGLAAGAGLLALVFWAVRGLVALFGNYIGLALDLRLVLRPKWLLASAALSALVLALSAWLPARRAGRMSAIEAIRGSGSVRVSRRARRSGRWMGRVFGPAGLLAQKSAVRSWRRYLATVASLTVSVVLLVVSGGFAGDVERAYSAAHPLQDWQVQATLYTTADSAAPGDWGPLLHPAAPVDRVWYREHITWGDLDLAPEQLTGAALAALGRTAADGPAALRPYILVLPDEEYKALTGADAAAIDPADPVLDVAVQNSYQYQNDGAWQTMAARTALRTGDTMAWAFNGLAVTLRVAAVTDGPLPQGVPAFDSPADLLLYTSRSAAQSMFTVWNAVRPNGADDGYCRRLVEYYYQTPDPAALKAELDRLKSTATVMVTNYAAESEWIRATLVLVRVVLYGFAGLMALVCAANIANTVSTGVALRQREFAMLQSVGMTPRTLRRMVVLESALYALQALAIGLPLGLALCVQVWRWLRAGYAIPFAPPWAAMAAAILSAFALTAATALPALRRLRAGSLVEDLRADIP